MGRGWCHYLDSEEEPLKRVGNAKEECEGGMRGNDKVELEKFAPRPREMVVGCRGHKLDSKAKRRKRGVF